MKLSSGQKQALEAINNGENVFITGEAGTGKNYLVKELLPKGITRTASTGVAALNINGITIHSFVGIKPWDEMAHRVVKRMNPVVINRIVKAKQLLIDEVSMVSANLFELIDEVLRLVRIDQRPFGGLQLILVGDFMQLSPIKGNFCFKSPLWEKMNIKTVLLKQNFRQGDSPLSLFLNKVRNNQIEKKDWDQFKETCLSERDTSDYIKLLPTNRECQQINLSKIRGLDGLFNFNADCEGSEYEIDFFFKNSLVEKKLTLAKGASVMMLTNQYMDDGIANGSQGVVIDFNSFDIPVVKFNNGVVLEVGIHKFERKVITPEEGEKSKAVIRQIPLKLSWALTIHKAQGLTLEKVYCDFKNIFADSQAYVAVSRIKDIKHLYIDNFNKGKFTFNEEAINFYKNLNQ